MALVERGNVESGCGPRMSKRIVIRRILVVPLLAAFVLAVLGAIGGLAQVPNEFIQMFGAMMQSALVQAVRTEWAKLPENERVCIDQALRAQGASLEGAIQRGIGPSDMRLFEIRQDCTRDVVAPHLRQPQSSQPGSSQVRPLESAKSMYSIEGLALGERVFNKISYRDYKCESSEQFPVLTSCRKISDGESNGQRFKSFSRILHAADGEAVYINRELEPAFFRPNDLNDEIARLSARFGSQPSVIRMPSRPGYSNGIIASWGEVALEPLDADSVAELAAGRNVRRGYMIDFIANFGRSAQMGLPIYRLGGRAGFVYAASHDEKGRGRLRFFAVDVSAFSPRAPLPAPEPLPASKENLKIREARDYLEVVRRCLSEQERPVSSIDDIVRKAARLQMSIDSANELAAAQTRRELNDTMQTIPGFKECQLTGLINEADKNIFFIDRYTMQNLGDKTVEPLRSIRKKLWQTIATNSIDAINEVNAEVQNYVTTYGIRDRYDNIVLEFPAPKKTKPIGTE